MNRETPAGDELSREPVVYLGLGSNVGDREANLHEAIERIKRLGLDVTRVSSIYETEPVGYADQQWFLNQVIEAEFSPELTFNAEAERDELLKREFKSSPSEISIMRIEELLCALHAIERDMGRKRTIVNGPRVIDIDILIVRVMNGFITTTASAADNISDETVERAMPIIPHPRMHQRRFVLEPLCEIAPDLVLSEFNKTCCEMLAALDDPAAVRLYRSRV